MKYSEFKRRVEELGFGVKPDEFGDSAVHDSDHYHVATIDEVYAFKLDTTFRLGGIHEVFENPDGEKLFDILVEYAKTPIPERKDQKKYQIHPIWTKDSVLVRWSNEFRKGGYENEHSFEIGSFGRCKKTNTTVFPESVAREICDYFGWDFDKVAREVDDEE